MIIVTGRSLRLGARVPRWRVLAHCALMLLAGPLGVDASPFVVLLLPFFVATFPLRLTLETLHGLGSPPLPRERLARTVPAVMLLAIAVPMALSAAFAPRHDSFEALRSSPGHDRNAEDTFQACSEAALGGSSLAWFALVAAVAAGGYALLSRRLDRIEVPRPLTNGWKREPFPVCCPPGSPATAPGE